MSGAQVVFRITYARYGELRDDITQQMALGALLVKIHDASDLTLDTPVQLALVLPDGTTLEVPTVVLQVLAGFGVAVNVSPEFVDQARRAAGGHDGLGAPPARHERISPGTPPAANPAPKPPERTGTARSDGLTRAEKIQQALHGTRDERNAILRDRDRSLHPFVLKNPRLDADDVVAIAKNAQMSAELLKQIGERKDWLQRPAVATALARNPKTPPDLAVRALEHVSKEALRQIAKGTGVRPHVTQAARKKLLG